MNPNPNKTDTSTSEGSSSSSGTGATLSPSSPPEGTEGVLPLPTHETPNTDVETEKPSRAGSFGDGSYEGTDGYAKSVTSYPSTANARKNAAAASEGASHTKAPGK